MKSASLSLTKVLVIQIRITDEGTVQITEDSKCWGCHHSRSSTTSACHPSTDAFCSHPLSSPETILWWTDWEKVHSALKKIVILVSTAIPSRSSDTIYYSGSQHWAMPHLALATPPPTPQRKPPTGRTAGSGGKASPFDTEDSENDLPLTKIPHQFFFNCNPCNSKLLELPHC